MTMCAACQQPIDEDQPSAIRSGEVQFHLACAPASLLAEVYEEYEAILRKGVRYFVEKYRAGPVDATRPGPQFIELGSALEAERSRRARQ
jgi:hypothetical protein